MAEVVFRSTQYLSDPDLAAIATYLRELPQATAAKDDTGGWLWFSHRKSAPPLSAEARERGAEVYKNQCADCHGDELQGDGKKATPLKGAEFMKTWKTKPVHKLIDQTWRTMPPDEPRTLSRELCADVAAFILAENGYPTGKAELKHDAPDVRQIVIEPPRK
jgi:mono/diheme cytochrome c family protein